MHRTALNYNFQLISKGVPKERSPLAFYYGGDFKDLFLMEMISVPEFSGIGTASAYRSTIHMIRVVHFSIVGCARFRSFKVVKNKDFLLMESFLDQIPVIDYCCYKIISCN